MSCWIARWSSMAVAVAIALALPLGGVRTQLVEIHCCCPSPERCKCPDHDTAPLAPTMQACHRTVETFATPAIAAFVPPVQVALALAPIEVAFEHRRLASPHAPPPPRRPDAPS